MQTFAPLALALLLGASAAGAQNAQPDAQADGVGTANDSATGRIQSTSPRASEQGQASVSEHTGSAVGAADKADTGKDSPAASGAGEATATGAIHGKAKAKARPGRNDKAASNTERGPTADAKADANAWPGASVDSSEIT